MTETVVHQVEIAERAKSFSVQRCAQLLLANGAQPDDVIEIRRYGQLIQTALLHIATSRS